MSKHSNTEHVIRFLKALDDAFRDRGMPDEDRQAFLYSLTFLFDWAERMPEDEFENEFRAWREGCDLAAEQGLEQGLAHYRRHRRMREG